VAKDILKRGFKAEAERTSIRYRKELDLEGHAPLCAFKLAEHLKIGVFKANEWVNSAKDIQLLNGSDWSALTMKGKSGSTIIIHNPYNSPARQQADIMHELSHIICGHSFENHDTGFQLPMGMRSFNELFEEEAKCLGATLQLTKDGLLWGLRNDMNVAKLAEHFNASTEMVNYRLRMSGAAKQYSYYK